MTIIPPKRKPRKERLNKEFRAVLDEVIGHSNLTEDEKAEVARGKRNRKINRDEGLEGL